jgi:hypothetical protein
MKFPVLTWIHWSIQKYVNYPRNCFDLPVIHILLWSIKWDKKGEITKPSQRIPKRHWNIYCTVSFLNIWFVLNKFCSYIIYIGFSLLKMKDPMRDIQPQIYGTFLHIVHDSESTHGPLSWLRPKLNTVTWCTDRYLFILHLIY